MITYQASWGERTLHDLFLLNVALQLFDGVATYQGLRLGFQEANPLLRATFQLLGVENTLLLFKAHACGLLFLLHRYRQHRVIQFALATVALVHVLFSFLPWTIKLLSAVS
ncbi:MAG: DUF5658 family protein [Candidatus Binatia bacterium]|nr:DUF5658 family protein [Candidatus Binatia bacterium]